MGTLQVSGEPGLVRPITDLLHEVIQILMTNNLKRMLTTEIHTQVVRQSYEELLESHQSLERSERKYRELSQSLDAQVKERTRELQLVHAKLLQQEKMAAVGQLAAGVAHELNTPLGFIASNLHSLGKYVSRLTALLLRIREQAGGKSGALCALDLEEQWRVQKLDFILEDIPELIEQSCDGAKRVQRIVEDLKGFSNLDGATLAELELEQELERALRVLSGKLPEGTRIHRNFEPLALVNANPALISQLFFNLISNAIWVSDKPLVLSFRNWTDAAGLHLSIADNGPGIDPAILPRIFDPFFTTRDVGEGTGMGLTVAYDIVHSLGGILSAYNVQSGGACFELCLPPQE